MALQFSQVPQGSIAELDFALPGLVQFRARAMIRAVVVLPTPRTPVNKKACATRPLEKAFPRVRTKAS